VTNRPHRVTRALTRAQRPREAGKRWKPKVGTAAKRGDLFVFTMQVPYVVPQGDKVRRRSEYALAIVTTVTREGRVTSYRWSAPSTLRNRRRQESSSYQLRSSMWASLRKPMLRGETQKRGHFAL